MDFVAPSTDYIPCIEPVYHVEELHLSGILQLLQMHETKGDATQIKKKMCSKCDHGAPCTMGGLRP